MSNIYLVQGDTIEAQYADAGRVFASEIQKEVNVLAKKRAKATRIRREAAERAWEVAKANVQCREFCAAIEGWSRGAGIKPTEAMWLMADNLSGCQTMIARYGSGVALLHTEEEFIDGEHTELHMSRPHTMSFRFDNEVARTLVYNNLLPGCGLYAWKKDLLVACDSLFLRQDGIEKVKNPLLANMVSWMVWQMSPEEASASGIATLISSLGELVDGYAINVVRKVGKVVEGYKLILARGEVKVEYLTGEPGSCLWQTNIVAPKYYPMRWVLPPRKIWRGGWRYFLQREKNLENHAKEYTDVAHQCLRKERVEWVHRAVQGEIFTKLRESYLNPDVGMVCVGLLDQVGLSVSGKLNNGEPPEVLTYLDVQN